MNKTWENSSVRPRRLLWATAAFTCLLGAVSFAGWRSGLVSLASWRSSFIPMAPSTALLFILLGIGLALAGLERRLGVRMLISTFGSLVTLLGMLKLFAFAFDEINLLEAFLVQEPELFGLVPLARMSPITASCFVIAGLSLNLSGLSIRGRLRHLGGYLAVIVFTVAATIVVGYLYGTPLLYGGHVIPVALPTGLAFMTTAVGLFIAGGPNRFPLRHFLGDSPRPSLLRAFLPLTAVAILSESVISHQLQKSFPINRALLAAVLVLLFVAVMAVIVSKIAAAVGSRLEKGEEDRLRLEKIREVFGLFTTPEVAQFALSHIDNLSQYSERTNVTILFADVRGFTSYANTAPPEKVVEELNEIFDLVVREVKAQGGILNKFMGDGIMALFGAPVPIGEHARRAARAAVRAQAAIENLANLRLMSGRAALRVGIGINTGDTIAGCMGTKERMEYSVIGNAVNLAARLEKAAAAGQILLGPGTTKALGDEFYLRPRGQLNLAGFSAPVLATELIAMSPKPDRRAISVAKSSGRRFWDVHSATTME